MKLEAMNNVAVPASLLYDDTGSQVLAAGDPRTLEHLLQCRATLKMLVDTATQPCNASILDRAKRLLISYKE